MSEAPTTGPECMSIKQPLQLDQSRRSETWSETKQTQSGAGRAGKANWGHGMQASAHRHSDNCRSTYGNAPMTAYELSAPYSPQGDQPTAIKRLLGVNNGERYQTLLGATGTGNLQLQMLRKTGRPPWCSPITRQWHSYATSFVIFSRKRC